MLIGKGFQVKNLNCWLMAKEEKGTKNKITDMIKHQLIL